LSGFTIDNSTKSTISVAGVSVSNGARPALEDLQVSVPVSQSMLEPLVTKTATALAIGGTGTRPIVSRSSFRGGNLYYNYQDYTQSESAGIRVGPGASIELKESSSIGGV